MEIQANFIRWILHRVKLIYSQCTFKNQANEKKSSRKKGNSKLTITEFIIIEVDVLNQFETIFIITTKRDPNSILYI